MNGQELLEQLSVSRPQLRKELTALRKELDELCIIHELRNGCLYDDILDQVDGMIEKLKGKE